MARFHPSRSSSPLFVSFRASVLVTTLLACAGVFALSAMVCDSVGPRAELKNQIRSDAPGAGTGAGQTKVVVCHRSADTGTFKPITIASPAVQAHLAHGDCLLDDGDPCTQ